MNQLFNEAFLLNTATGRQLYHKYAATMPIYDYHCHINPREIWEDHNFQNITEAWLHGDHYKWRLMRLDGVDEKYITGDADDYEKFFAWARTISRAIGNPLYHWTHLELQRYFNIHEPLNSRSADRIWHQANAYIATGQLSVRKIIEKFNVKLICTTDDPLDDLKYHKLLGEQDNINVKILPSFRPDKAVEIGRRDFLTWLDRLKSISAAEIGDLEQFLAALEKRVDYFHAVGCLLADHDLNDVVYEYADHETVATVFQKALDREKLHCDEINKFRTYMLLFFGRLYAQRNWVMQYHMGAMRNNNSLMYEELGADKGFDSVNDAQVARPLSRLLDSLDRENLLPKTILYNLNPADNYVLATMMGNFYQAGIGSKIQFGAAWWFNDHKDGMTKHLKTFANLGILSRFIGMLTDSRSFLSYTRHEYFRRILCDLFGEWVENGEYPDDLALLGEIVQDICSNNVKDYLGIS